MIVDDTHSKLMIVDDKWITIGSANTDKDGLQYSTEFDLGIASADLSPRLRVKLWRELSMFNFEEGFKAWEVQSAEENGKRVRRRESIQGHVYYYNFEEMNYPPPYPQAKGGNKFRFF